MITYAVVGRDESATLEQALGQLLEAAGPGDAVWFVDSASSDGSADVARRLGVEVVPAPAGKGRAVAVAVERSRGGLLCLLDADIEASSCNIAAALRDRHRATGADMVIGNFAWPGRELSITHTVHTPLVRALFPEYLELLAPQPLSGFRLLDTSFPLGRLPAGYGLECHLNVHVAATGGRIAWAELGTYHGPLRFRRTMAAEIGEAILDVAQAQGRLSREERSGWDEWIRPIVDLIASRPDFRDDEVDDYRRRLAELVARPPPSSRHAAIAR